jgi:peptidoglycan/LPS O-acetylase OafA/YrhL
LIGFLRLFLASAVALAHADVALFGYHLGVPAVVVFYFLAGYVVALQWRELAAGSPGAAAFVFLRDRALRLLPCYGAVLVLAALVTWLFQPDTYFLSRPFDAQCILGNTLIVPINYFSFNGLDRCSLIPVAWSLGLEIQFYLLVPFIIGRPIWMLVLGIASLAIYLLAGAGWIGTDLWGYRLLPGTLFIFLMGVAFADQRFTWIAWLIALLAIFWLGFVLVSEQAPVDFAAETAFGIVLATPLLALARHFGRSATDDLAGRIAYPLFLVHLPSLWVVDHWASGARTPLILLSYLAFSVVAAVLLARWIDLPLTRIRRRWRLGRQSAA